MTFSLKASLLLSLLLAAPAFSATTYTEGGWSLQTSTGTQPATSLEDCKAKWKAMTPPAKQRTVYCRQQLITKVTTDPIPVPVDCVVSAWSEWTGGAWSACANGTQTRAEGRSRSVVTAPSNGGTACPVLTETRTATQSCQTPSGTLALYTDMTHAPIGAPLTVCGKGFGETPKVTIGGLSAEVLQTKASLSPITECVRVTFSGTGVVSVNGAAGPTVTTQPGDILYVSQSGNDATAAKNDPARPWRYLQKSDRTGAFGAAKPGDVIIVRGGTWRDIGFDGAWVRPHAEDGTAPTGVKGTGYITVTGYPGEKVIVQGQTRGGVMGGSSARKGIAGRYMVFSNLAITGGTSTDGAPINLQYASDNWRVVNNDLTWPNAPSAAKAGGITGIGTNAKILGVWIHDIGGPYENHGIYLFSEAQDIEIGWTAIQRVALGNLFQTYDGSSPTGIRRIFLHDSLLEDGGRYGINVGNQTRELTVANVTVRDTALAGLRFDINATWAVDFWIHHSTFEGVNTKGSQSSRGVVNCDWQLTNATRALVEQNKFSAGAAATSYYSVTGAGCPALKFSGNTWSGLSGLAGP
jgi:hypothetical protein